MAQKRLLDKKISLSEKVAELEILGQLLYERMILHADDFGLLQASPRTVKALVIPMIDTTSTEVAQEITKMLKNGLLRTIIYEKKSYYKIVDFGENQRLRRDMQPYTILPIKLGKNYEDNWKKVYKLVESKAVTISDEIATEVKLSKDKIRYNTVSIEKTVLKKLPDITEDKDYITCLADDISKALGDTHSDKFFKLVAAKVPEKVIRETLSEIKTDGAKNPAKVFTYRMNRYAIGHI